LHQQRIIHEDGSGHHNQQVSLHLFLGMCSLCNEFVVKRLGQGDVDERSGEEVQDNCQVDKETTHATCRFPQARGELELVDVRENQIWIELHKGGWIVISQNRIGIECRGSTVGGVRVQPPR
jgi:hypothetical protein